MENTIADPNILHFLSLTYIRFDKYTIVLVIMIHCEYSTKK